MSFCENQYISLLSNILENGELKETRNGKTLSLFSEYLKIDLRHGFPLLTTKKVFLRGIIEELLFFIRGSTDSKLLENKNINIWKGNTSREFLDSLHFYNRIEGLMGPMYGYQWRNFNAVYDDNTGLPLNNGIDQLQNLIDLIKTDPNSRRLLLTSYNPLQADNGNLYPCHSVICQFYCDNNNHLDMNCYNRSQDVFHGVPFNIASSALLLIFISNLTNKTPRFLNIIMGDVHIYQSHIDAVKTQISRVPYQLPKLEILKKLNTLDDICNLSFDDFILYDYKFHSPIKVDMVV